MKLTFENSKINTPITLIVIGVLAIGILIFLAEATNKEPASPYQPADVSDNTEPQPAAPEGGEPRPKDSGREPHPDEDLWGGCQELVYDPNIDYNFVGALNFVQVKPPVQFLEIKPDQKKRTFSLGKYKLPLEIDTALIMPKLWLYFFSEKLSDRDDDLYGLEDSYLSKIILKVGDKSKEIKLSKSGEHSFVELLDCPLGNIQAVNYETELTFEILLEIGCNNLKDGECLDNNGKSLSYIDDAELTVQIRVFAISAAEFTKDISIITKFRYE